MKTVRRILGAPIKPTFLGCDGYYTRGLVVESCLGEVASTAIMVTGVGAERRANTRRRRSLLERIVSALRPNVRRAR